MNDPKDPLLCPKCGKLELRHTRSSCDYARWGPYSKSLKRIKTAMYSETVEELKVKINSIMSRLRLKIEETDRERAAQEIAHAKSSDYTSLPSMRVARLEGQVTAFKWILEELERMGHEGF